MRVSGGVDVFFVVSGFLITTSLLSKYARDGYIKFSTYILGLLKRLLPNALIVLFFVVVAGYFILPEARHSETIREVIASLLYYENWQLAITGTDYLDQNNEKSPVQHFWAMSIQGQFYIIWFLLIGLTIFLHKRFKADFKKLFFVILTVLFVLSFGYSIYLTAVNQPWAYFDTRTRVWEFAIGGILMLFIFKVQLPKILSFVMGWIGLIGLISTGLVLEVETSFPGYVALWPVLSAVMIMLAGQTPTNFGVEKLLGSKPMVKLGGLSYGLYLWHWPLLAFYYIIFDTQNVSIIHGVILIGLSLLLSYISTKLVEQPIVAFISDRKNSFKSFAPIYSMTVALILIVSLWFGYNQYQSSLADQFNGDPNYPGALANTEEFSDVEKLEPIPNLGSLKNDKAEPYNDGCHVSPGVSEVEVCEYGETENYDYTVALVGGSKSTHWLPSLQSFSEEESIRALNVTKSGCRFSYVTEGDGRAQDCIDWNTNVVDKLVKSEVDLVVTLADIRTSGEEVPQGYLNQFNRLNDAGLEVLAIRDTPHFNEDISECLSSNGLDTDLCDIDRSEIIPDESAWDKLQSPPPNVTYVDYTDYICSEETCPAVIGNIIGYMDKNHMTATFNETLGPLVRNDVISLLSRNPDTNNTSSIEQSAAEDADDDSIDETSSHDNLLEFEGTETGWINFDGEISDNNEYRITTAIEYEPEKDYTLTIGSYISYYSGEEFIKTVQHNPEESVEQVEEADNIKVSYHYTFEDRIELIKE